ncbi:MAG: hypothetical protein EON56_01255 [Alphaproteobacteria bacterium]|nr:MAG: hypothetical protein EON56_01255 [Alphaproteobacteria bacterium]
MKTTEIKELRNNMKSRPIKKRPKLDPMKETISGPNKRERKDPMKEKNHDINNEGAGLSLLFY